MPAMSQVVAFVLQVKFVELREYAVVINRFDITQKGSFTLQGRYRPHINALSHIATFRVGTLSERRSLEPRRRFC